MKTDPMLGSVDPGIASVHPQGKHIGSFHLASQVWKATLCFVKNVRKLSKLIRSPLVCASFSILEVLIFHSFSRFVVSFKWMEYEKAQKSFI